MTFSNNYMPCTNVYMLHVYSHIGIFDCYQPMQIFNQILEIMQIQKFKLDSWNNTSTINWYGQWIQYWKLSRLWMQKTTDFPGCFDWWFESIYSISTPYWIVLWSKNELIVGSSFSLGEISLSFQVFFCRIHWVQLFFARRHSMVNLISRISCRMILLCIGNIDNCWNTSTTILPDPTLLSRDFAPKWTIWKRDETNQQSTPINHISLPTVKYWHWVGIFCITITNKAFITSFVLYQKYKYNRKIRLIHNANVF